MDPFPFSVMNLVAGVLPDMQGVTSLYLDPIHLLLYKVHHCMPVGALVLEGFCMALKLKPLSNTMADPKFCPQQGF